MQKFTGDELEERMLKPPIRKIRKQELVVEFDFTKYNPFYEERIEEPPLRHHAYDDEVYEP